MMSGDRIIRSSTVGAVVGVAAVAAVASLVCPLTDDVGDPVQDPGALTRRRARPLAGVERGPGGGGRSVDIGRASIGDHLPSRGVDDVEPAAVDCFRPAAPNVQLTISKGRTRRPRSLL
jgi:hypothetical protein